jgi:hypothetical protein
VIDDTIGAIDGLLDFGGATGLPDTHQFRVESWEFENVHSLTVMTASQ